MSRTPPCALSVALITGLAIGPGFVLSAYAKDQQASSATFRGVRLGMTETEALAHIDRMAPGAFVGPLCTGNIGVGSYLNHNGLDWQIMAHIRNGYVHQIKLFRFDRTGTKTSDECRDRFDDLSGEQRGSYPNLIWEHADASGGRYSVKARTSATLPDATSIELTVERLDWQKARCAIEMVISSAQTQ